MKKALLYIWQLPQNLLALILIGIFSLCYGKPEKYDYKGVTYVWFPSWIGGVSLGCYVLIGDYYEIKIDTVNHEWGHTRQSIIFGPLYLLLIGLPSGTWSLIDRLLMAVCKKWTWNKSYRIYYSMPWEHWADELGGVTRHFEE